LHGVGKTQTALEYAYLYHLAYKAVLWCQAHSHEALVADFAALAGLLDLSEKIAEDHNLIVAASKTLARTEWWLAVDSGHADDIPMMREFIPADGMGHVLLTTRAMTTGTIALHNTIEKRDPREGAFFLLRRLKKLREGEPLGVAPVDLLQQAENLSKVLYGLPLALDQAAADIDETPSILERFRYLYQSERKNS
jgi:hypothetical protein